MGLCKCLARACVLLGMLLFPALASAGNVVWIVLSTQGSPHLAASSQIADRLQQTSPRPVEIHPLSAAEFSTRFSSGPELHTATLIIAIGSAAADAVLQIPSPVPVLATLIPKSVSDRIHRESREPLAATGESRGIFTMYMDQPPARQMALIRAAFPGSRQVAVLTGSGSPLPSGEMISHAKRLGLSLRNTRTETPETLVKTLSMALQGSDILLALPDPLVYNAHTTQNILLHTYRNRIPVLGYSQSFVNAGAALGVFTTPAQIAAQTVETARDILLGKTVPRSQAPQQFTVEINQRVIRSLGLIVSDARTLHSRVLELSGDQK